MTDTVFNLDLYKIPSDYIRQNRRVFYSFRRRSDDKTTAWLKRVQNCILRCEFPKIILEFLLFDRFIDGLDADELKSIQNIKKSWTLKQLLEHCSDENIDSGGEHIECNLAIEDENSSLGVVKSEPNEEEWIQIGPPSQTKDEADLFNESNIIEGEHASVDDYVACEIEETNSGQTLNEEEIDNDMVNNAIQFASEDHKFSFVDAVAVNEINEESGKNHLDKKKRRERERPFACDECDKAFTKPNSLKTHKISVHQGIHPHGCEQCDKRFASSFELKIHSRTHTGERPYACDECDKLCSTSSNLTAHKNNVHRGIRSHVCTECGKRFTYSNHLQQHMRTHTGERPFACEQCDKRFKTSRNLKAHALTHTVERPFACDKCNKTFTNSHSLNKHVEIVHQRTRPHMCEQCGKDFSSIYNLKCHLITHSGAKSFTCDQCNMSFVLSSILKRHIKVKHQQIRPHACEQCDKHFASTQELERHSKKHRVKKEKSKTCDQCNKTFSQVQNLRQHKRTVHQQIDLYACEQCDEHFASAQHLKKHSITHKQADQL